jgi:hypothetical protein
LGKVLSFGPLTRTGGVRGLTFHCLEFTALTRDHGPREHADPTAQLHEHGTGLAKGRAILPPGTRDCLVVWNPSTGQPHQLDIPPGVAFQPVAPGDPVQRAADEHPEQHSRMIHWPPGACGRVAFTTKHRQIKLVSKQTHQPNKMIVSDPVVQPRRK